MREVARAHPAGREVWSRHELGAAPRAGVSLLVPSGAGPRPRATAATRPVSTAGRSARSARRPRHRPVRHGLAGRESSASSAPYFVRHYVPVWRNLWIPAMNARLQPGASIPMDRPSRRHRTASTSPPRARAPSMVPTAHSSSPPTNRATVVRAGAPSPPRTTRACDGRPTAIRAVIGSSIALRKGQTLDVTSTANETLGIVLLPTDDRILFRQPPPGVDARSRRPHASPTYRTSACPHRTMNRALFLDRDGVLDELVFYPSSNEWESPRTLDDLVMIDRHHRALQRFVDAGWLLFIVTNQPSYAKGKTTMEDTARRARRRRRATRRPRSRGPTSASTTPTRSSPTCASRANAANPARNRCATPRASSTSISRVVDDRRSGQRSAVRAGGGMQGGAAREQALGEQEGRGGA